MISKELTFGFACFESICWCSWARCKICMGPRRSYGFVEKKLKARRLAYSAVVQAVCERRGPGSIVALA